MARWMFATISLALIGSLAQADDGSLYGRVTKTKSRQNGDQVIRVVTADAQPLPAVPAAPAAIPATTGTPYVAVSGTSDCVDRIVSRAADDGCPPRRTCFSRRPQQCEGCSSLRYDLWFGLGPCRSFFGEGPYAPKWPDNCPTCCPRR